MRALVWGALVCAACVGSAAAAGPQRLSAYVAAEGQPNADRPLHGIVIVAWDAENVSSTTDLSAELNTDTLRLAATEIPLEGQTTLNLRLSGEAFVAGLSTDAWRDGAVVPAETFRSSYVQGQIWVKGRPAGDLWAEAELGVRRWIFQRVNGDTGADFTLPADTSVLEPRLRLTWWGLRDDAAWHERQRLFPRLRGFAAGVEAGVDLRGTAHDWGAGGASHGSVGRQPGGVPIGALVDQGDRNRRRDAIARLRPWALAGWQATHALRWQGSAEGGLTSGDDDVSRRTVGGLNAYTAQIPGVPWAHDRAGNYAHAETSLQVAFCDGWEAGPLAAVAVLSDRERTGSSDAAAEWGLGAVLDARLGAWQLDLRGGYSPSLAARSDKPAFTAYLGAGWAGGLQQADPPK